LYTLKGKFYGLLIISEFFKINKGNRETTINVLFPSSLLIPVAEMVRESAQSCSLFGILAQTQNGWFQNLSKIER